MGEQYLLLVKNKRPGPWFRALYGEGMCDYSSLSMLPRTMPVPTKEDVCDNNTTGNLLGCDLHPRKLCVPVVHRIDTQIVYKLEKGVKYIRSIFCHLLTFSLYFQCFLRKKSTAKAALPLIYPQH